MVTTNSAVGQVRVSSAAMLPNVRLSRSWVTWGQPFAAGAVDAAARLAAGGEDVFAEPITFWPDGSVRFAYCSAAVSGATDLEIVGSSGAPEFRLHPAVALGWPGVHLHMEVGGKLTEFSGYHAIAAGNGAILAMKGSMQAGPVWADVYVEFGDQCDHAKIWLHYGVSDGSQAIEHEVPELWFHLTGAHAHWAHPRHKTSGYEAPGRYRLMSAGRWTDSCSQMLRGYMVFPLSDAQHSAALQLGTGLLGGSLDWGAGDFGAYGTLPQRPAWMTSEVISDRAVSDYNAAVRDPWHNPILSVGRRPSDTGDKVAFQRIPGADLAYGELVRISAFELSAYQEACRPIWARRGGELYRYSQNASIDMWESRPYKTGDCLGKDPNVAGQPGFRSLQGFYGMDKQHHAIGPVGVFTQVTGDRLGRVIMNQYAETMVQEMRTNTGNAVIDGLDAARGEGRHMQSAAWVWRCTGRSDVARGMTHRLDHNAGQLTRRKGGPLSVLNSSQLKQWLPGAAFGWLPWWEALGLGLWAGVLQSRGHRQAEILGMAEHLLRYGIVAAPPGGVGCLGAHEYLEGRPDEGRQEWAQDNGDAPYLYNPRSLLAAQVVADHSADAALRARAEGLLAQHPATEWQVLDQRIR